MDVLSRDEDLRIKLVDLQTQHRDLDNEILALIQSGSSSQVQIQRLKKRKLALKDMITQLENQLIPDIIA